MSEQFEWRFSDDGNSEWASVSYKGYSASIADCDGDFSTWRVFYSEGSNDSCEPYHFDVARAKAEAALIKLSSMDQKWMPIETAPRTGRDILLWDGALIRLGFWDNNYSGFSIWPGRAECKYPTHWMPLPEPPK